MGVLMLKAIESLMNWEQGVLRNTKVVLLQGLAESIEKARGCLPIKRIPF